MTFEDKRELLHWLSDRKDNEGNPNSIYMNMTGKSRGKEQIADYFISSKID
jgi:hypothetical protein